MQIRTLTYPLARCGCHWPGDSRLVWRLLVHVPLHLAGVLQEAANAHTAGRPGGGPHDARYCEPELIPRWDCLARAGSGLHVQQWQERRPPGAHRRGGKQLALAFQNLDAWPARPLCHL